ncbi:MAG: sodium/glutamate symporter [Gammaproteobacteria bacterium]
MSFELDNLDSLIMAIALLLVGRLLVFLIHPLKQYNIPVPVVGGLVFAGLLAFLQTSTDIRLSFDTDLRSVLMLAFFASVGLSADLARLRRGGVSLAIFLLVVTLFLVFQNAIGAATAYLLDLHPAIGLLAGSITLSGGHGTGVAWAERFAEVQNLSGALELSVACATFGLVIGGLIGGPVSQFLITRHQLKPPVNGPAATVSDEPGSETPGVNGMLATLFLIMLAIVAGNYLYAEFKDAAVKLPGFIWALFAGVLLRNLLGMSGLYRINEKGLDLLSTLALWLALALTFMGLKLWELVDLAGPLLVVMLAQTVGIVLFATFITFRLLGANYDAAVMAAGHCGFGMGATPTAIANMQAVSARYGPSPLSFIVVPMIGAFFIDFLNALIIQGFLELPLHGF